MSNNDIEIEVTDPTAPAEDSPPLARTLTVDIWAMITLGAFSLVMAWDNYKTGMGWSEDGPQPGYFPFYLSVILVLASVYGVIKSLAEKRAGNNDVFVTRDQFKRVLLVLLPTVAFCVGMQWLGLYVSAFLLTAAGDLRVKPYDWVAAPNVECADSLRSVDLMRCEAHKIYVERGDVALVALAEEDGRKVMARGADPDTLVASAKAYVSGLNKLVTRRTKSAPTTLKAV